MNTNPDTASRIATFFGILGSFLVVAGLVWVMQKSTRPAPLNQARAAERKKNLVELQAASVNILTNYGWQDPAKAIVRMPIADAMELTIKEYQNPAAAKSNLVARVEKATAVPPKPPEKPSEYE